MIFGRNVFCHLESKFIEELYMQHWEYIYFFCTDPNAMWELWKELFLEILNKHAPLQHKKIKCNKVPWITNKIKELITMRDNLKRKAIVTKSETDWLKYKRARNKVNIELRKSKRIELLFHKNC